MIGGRDLSDAQWAVIEPFMPRLRGRSRPFRDHRQVVEGVAHRYRCGITWRDLPPRGLVRGRRLWKRHQRFCVGDTWDEILAALLAQAAFVGDISIGW